MMAIFSEFASAKVNLTLDVLGKRSDGYHELASLVAFARNAADVVTIDISKPIGNEVSGPFGATIAGRNLIDVTLAKLAAAAPDLRLGRVYLIKNLPIAAGIGGGSADAAAILRAVCKANPKHAEIVDWLGIARTLGADVPVCLKNCAAWITGIGDRVDPISDLPELAAVLVNPLQPMPVDKTARVFRALKAGPVTSAVAQPPTSFQSAGSLLDYMTRRGNALEAAACKVAPVIADVKRAITHTPGCLYAAVSGGGPTCFGIFQDNVTAAALIQRVHPEWWVQAVTLG